MRTDEQRQSFRKRFIPIFSSVPHTPVDFLAAPLCPLFCIGALFYYIYRSISRNSILLSELFPEVGLFHFSLKGS